MYIYIYTHIYSGTWLSRPWLSRQPSFSLSLTFGQISLDVKDLFKPPNWPLALAMVLLMSPCIA